MKTCIKEGCDLPTEGNTDFCGSHNRMNRKIAANRIKEAEKREAMLSRPQPKRIPVKKISDKRKTENEIYSRLREEFLKLNPECEVKMCGICTKVSTTAHHMKGRGILLNETKYWLSACLPCHQYVELHPIEAMKKGFSISRLATQNPTI